MDYGNLLRRSWDIIWNHKFMIVLGLLAGLGSGMGSSGGNNSGYQFSGDELPFLTNPQFGPEMAAVLGAAGAILAALLCLFLIIGFLLWLLRLTAQAGLIDAAARLEAGQKVTIGEALGAGWRYLWRMIGLNIVLFGVFFIMAIVAAILVASGIVATVGSAQGGGDLQGLTAGLGFGVLALICCLFCVFVVVAIVAGVLYPFAQRAVVLENHGVLAGIGRGWRVIRENLGEVIVLLLIFLVLGLVMAAIVLVIFIPLAALSFAPMAVRLFGGGTVEALDVGLLLGGLLCFSLLVAAIRSVYTAFQSTVFTLAYQEFTVKKLPTA